MGHEPGIGNSTPILTLPSPTGATQAPQALPGLELETLYHYRVVAINSIGTSKGDDMTFTTHPAVTALETKPVSSVDQDSITLNAQFQGDNLDTKYFFEYGLTTAYGTNTGELDAGARRPDTGRSRNHPVQRLPDIPLPGSRQKQLRHNQRTGPDLRRAGSSKAGDRKHRSGDRDPDDCDGLDRCQPQPLADDLPLEWGETHEYGTATPFSEPIGGPDNEPIQVSQELTGLVPGTICFVRVVAANFRGPPRVKRSAS